MQQGRNATRERLAHQRALSIHGHVQHRAARSLEGGGRSRITRAFDGAEVARPNQYASQQFQCGTRALRDEICRAS